MYDLEIKLIFSKKDDGSDFEKRIRKSVLPFSKLLEFDVQVENQGVKNRFEDFYFDHVYVELHQQNKTIQHCYSLARVVEEYGKYLALHLDSKIDFHFHLKS